jgi:hypothetical protein
MPTFDLPQELQQVAKQIRHLYYESHKDKIKESQKKYRNREKSEEDKQKLRNYANTYYKEKVKPVRQPTPKTEEQKQLMREYSKKRYHEMKLNASKSVIPEEITESTA